MVIEKDELCGLIPHAGSMCLLDQVLEWQSEFIICSSNSHKELNNPLRSEDGLSSIHAIEYGAQAMAVHGGLLLRQQGKGPRSGYLASIKKIHFNVNWLHEIEAPLVVRAKRILGDENSMIYEFEVSANDEIVARGQTTVINQTQGDK